MRKKSKTILTLIVLVLFMLGGCLTLCSCGSASQGADQYPPAKDFVFTDRSGKEYHLQDFYGKPIVINFFATWCPPCRGELPYFNDAYANYQDKINFLMIDMIDDGSETVENGLGFVTENDYRFPLYFDSKGQGFGTYGTNAIPVTVFISAEGGLVDTHVGSLEQAELQAMIDTLLNQ